MSKLVTLSDSGSGSTEMDGCQDLDNRQIFKGTVARGFPLPFCFIKSTHRGPRTGSHIFPLLVAAGRCDSLLHLAVESQNLPLQNAAGSQLLPLHHAAWIQILPLQYAAGSQILPLQYAMGSQILPPHDAAESLFGSKESSQKTLEDSLRP
jgi:hypothetical protein